ncbi:MAG TPA: sigma-70 family RNA polymerase sigma factor [Gemmataceae bacterium]|jgi:RNA polymerase sigma factor (sigma-70 family)
MANSKANKVIQQVRKAMLLRDGAGMTDGQLLDCFLTQRDDAAFAALVKRHAPMVWGVCRRVLHHHHDAEDAFQATFLVLVRKAATVEPKEMVGNWLYGVAYQTALKARSVSTRRREREKQMVEMAEPAVEEREVWNDLQPLLDQELSCLPDKYRVPIVLCDLEGKTRKEAARQLGWPEGTVAGRLAAGRKMLARRLARRGGALSGGVLAAVLSHNAAWAGVPPAVVSSTIQAATMLAAGQAAAAGLISVKVAALTAGVVKTMLLNPLKTATAVLLAVGILGAGGVVYRPQTTGRADAQGEQYALAMAGEENKPLARQEGSEIDQPQKGFEQVDPRLLKCEQVDPRFLPNPDLKIDPRFLPNPNDLKIDLPNPKDLKIDPRFLPNPDLKIDPRLFQPPEIDPRIFQPPQIDPRMFQPPQIDPRWFQPIRPTPPPTPNGPASPTSPTTLV